jgi:hypothetical protein
VVVVVGLAIHQPAEATRGERKIVINFRCIEVEGRDTIAPGGGLYTYYNSKWNFLFFIFPNAKINSDRFNSVPEIPVVFIYFFTFISLYILLL